LRTILPFVSRVPKTNSPETKESPALEKGSYLRRLKSISLGHITFTTGLQCVEFFSGKKTYLLSTLKVSRSVGHDRPRPTVPVRSHQALHCPA